MGRFSGRCAGPAMIRQPHVNRGVHSVCQAHCGHSFFWRQFLGCPDLCQGFVCLFCNVRAQKTRSPSCEPGRHGCCAAWDSTARALPGDASCAIDCLQAPACVSRVSSCCCGCCSRRRGVLSALRLLQPWLSFLARVVLPTQLPTCSPPRNIPMALCLPTSGICRASFIPPDELHGWRDVHCMVGSTCSCTVPRTWRKAPLASQGVQTRVANGCGVAAS